MIRLRLPQAVEALARHTGEGSDYEQCPEDRATAHEPDAVARRGAHLTPQGAAFAWSRTEVALPHQEDERRAERDGECAAEQERSPKRDGREEGAREHAHQGAEVICLLAAQVDPSEIPFSDFVRDPGLQRAADERVACAPDHLRGQDRDEDGNRALEHETRPYEEESYDHRQTAAVGICQYPCGHLEGQHRELEYRTHEHELQRVETDGLDPVHRGDRRV